MASQDNIHLFIHVSNKQEILADQLTKMLRNERADPLAPQSVIVQSRGMERWLRYRLASFNGIAMNLVFPFPRQVVNSLLKIMLGGAEPSLAFERTNMAWAIYDLLPGLLRQPAFDELRAYLADGSSLKRYQLAAHLAALFDELIVYRPELITKWTCDQINAEHWQAVLWRELRALWPEDNCFADLHARLASQWRTLPKDALEALPAELRLFGITILPPAFLDVLTVVSRTCCVHFFLLEPTAEYIGDLRSRRRPPHVDAATDTAAGPPAPAEVFLGRVARQSREMLDLLIERDAQQAFEGFEKKVPASRLEHAQLALCHAFTAPEVTISTNADNSDVSIAVHACSGPSREVEVLHSNLLALFEKIPGLRPDDILVMAPEIEIYASSIEAIFGKTELDVPLIPFTIADLQPRTRFRAVDAFLRWLDLPGSRFEASAVLTLIEHEAVRLSFAIDDAGMRHIRRWVATTGIHWGLDNGHRRALHQPPVSEGTWRHGVDSMLFGLALNGKELVDGHLPEASIEGERTQALGALARVISLAAELERESRTPRPLAEWAQLLEQFAGTILGGRDEFVPEYLEILRALQMLRELPAARLQSPDQKVEFDAVRTGLGDVVREFVLTGGFLTGGVTFCSLRPMRSIPARVICLLGIDEEKFPRADRAPKLNAVLASRRPGDRSIRSEDRQVFLESFLSARDVFYVSCTGIDAHTGDTKPLSPVIEEFLEFMNSLPADGQGKIEIQRHPLQPFSSRYATDASLPCYSAAAWRAATALLEGTGQPRALVSEMTQAPLNPEDRELSVEGFVKFFQDPVAWFFRNRLLVDYQKGEENIEDSEPFVLDNLREFHLRQESVASRLCGGEGARWDLRKAVAATSFGPVAEVEKHDVEVVAAAFSEDLCKAGVQPLATSMEVDLVLPGGIHVSGVIPGIFNGRLLVFHPAREKPAHLIRVWLLHLLRQTRGGDPSALASCFFVLDEKGELRRLTFSPCDDLEGTRSKLGDILLEGMQRPIPFFARTSYEFAKAWHSYTGTNNAERHKLALRKAEASWLGHWRGEAECAKPATSMAFPADVIEGDEFATLALAFWQPCLNSMEAGR